MADWHEGEKVQLFLNVGHSGTAEIWHGVAQWPIEYQNREGSPNKWLFVTKNEQIWLLKALITIGPEIWEIE